MKPFTIPADLPPPLTARQLAKRFGVSATVQRETRIAINASNRPTPKPARTRRIGAAR